MYSLKFPFQVLVESSGVFVYIVRDKARAEGNRAGRPGQFPFERTRTAPHFVPGGSYFRQFLFPAESPLPNSSRSTIMITVLLGESNAQTKLSS